MNTVLIPKFLSVRIDQFKSSSASVLFTNYDLIWFQIHEMLRIEKGGQEQVKDELEAYKDLIRKSRTICKRLYFAVSSSSDYCSHLQPKVENWLDASCMK